MIRDLTKMFNHRYIYRSSVDGRFVSRVYAILHPRETYAVRRYPNEIS